MSAELFRTVELDPQPDSLPDETVGSWLDTVLNASSKNADTTLGELNIHHPNHPAFQDLTYLYNKEAARLLSVRELWNRIRSARKTVRQVREKVSSLLNIRPEQLPEQ